MAGVQEPCRINSAPLPFTPEPGLSLFSHYRQPGRTQRRSSHIDPDFHVFPLSQRVSRRK